MAMVTAGLLVSVVSLLTLAMSLHSSHILKAELNRQLNGNVRQGIETFRRFQEEVNIKLALWSSQPIVHVFFTSPALAAVSRAGLAAFFAKIRTGEPWITDILLADGDTIIYEDSDIFAKPGKNSADYDRLIQRMSQPGLFMAMRLQDFYPERKKNLLMINRQFSKNGVPFPGKAIVLLADIEKLNRKLFHNYIVGHRGFMTFSAIDPNGNLLFPSQKGMTRETQDFMRSCREWKKLSDIPETCLSILLAYRRVPETPILVMGAASLNDIWKVRQSLICTLIMFGTVACIISIFGVIFLSKKITEPLSELTRKVRLFSAENGEAISAWEADDDRDEIRVLEDTFDEMTDKIREYTESLEEKVSQRTRELYKALDKITDSIQYAERIQRALLPNLSEMKNYLPDSFFIWKPKDVVGGDIYFTEYSKVGKGFIFAIIDCTGHGVPGAFMSMIASSALKRITGDEGCHNPAEILKRLNIIVKTTLHQDRDNAVSDDGLDAAVCFVKPEENVLIFAGARLPLFCVHNREANVIIGDKQSIGYKRSDINFSFTNHTVRVEKGTSFYISTDGFWDQLGGEKRHSFGKKRFKKLLENIAHLPFEKQQEMLIHTFEAYKGGNDRLDDVTVGGVRI